MQTAVFMFQYYHNMLALDNYFTFISSKHNFNTRLASKSTYYIDQIIDYINKLDYLLSIYVSGWVRTHRCTLMGTFI